MSRMPKISVAVPLYNKGAYIDETVKSALSQTFSDFEIIVVDDGSTDDGVSKVSNLGDSRIVVVTQDNAGAAAARNRALHEAQAPFVAFLDADDIWFPDHLLHLTNLSQRFPAVALFGNGFVEARAGERPPPPLENVEYRLLGNYFSECAFSREPFFTSSCMVRRERALELGGFPVGNFCGEDLALWIRIAACDQVAISDYIGCWYRRQPDSLSFQPSYRNAPDISMAALEELLRAESSMSAPRKRIVQEYYFRIALAHSLDCLIAGEVEAAKKFLQLSAETQAFRSRWRQATLLAWTPKPVRDLIFRLRR